MTKIAFIDQDLFGRSTDLDPCALTNLVVLSEPNNTRSTMPVVLRPGRVVELTLPTSPVRGLKADVNGNLLFAVAGNKFYTLDTNLTATQRGTLTSSTGLVKIEQGIDNIHIKNLASTDGYVYIPSNTGSFAAISDADYLDFTSITYRDSYHIGVKRNSSQFNLSAADDPSSWDPLAFVIKNGQPDYINQVLSHNDDLFLIGRKTTEVWYNSGDVFPFDKRTLYEQGSAGITAATKSSNGVCWIQDNQQGRGKVYRTTSYQPQEVGNPSITYKLQSLSTLSDVEAYSCSLDGNDFVIFQCTTANFTLVLNETNGYYSQWQDTDGTSKFPIRGCEYFANKVLIGDPASGKISSLSFGNITDNGVVFNWLIRTPSVYQDGHYMFGGRLQVDFEAGGSATATATMSISTDGGTVFTSCGTQVAGTGKSDRMVWSSLGRSDETVFQLAGTSNNPWRFFNLLFDYEVGNY